MIIIARLFIAIIYARPVMNAMDIYQLVKKNTDSHLQTIFLHVCRS